MNHSFFFLYVKQPDHVHISKDSEPMSDEEKDVKQEPTSTNNHAPQSDSVRSSTNSKRQGSKAEVHFVDLLSHAKCHKLLLVSGSFNAF